MKKIEKEHHNIFFTKFVQENPDLGIDPDDIDIYADKRETKEAAVKRLAAIKIAQKNRGKK